MLIHWIHSLTVGNLRINLFSIAECCLVLSIFRTSLSLSSSSQNSSCHIQVEVQTEKEHQDDGQPIAPSIASYDLGYEPEEWTLGIG